MCTQLLCIIVTYFHTLYLALTLTLTQSEQVNQCRDHSLRLAHSVSNHFVEEVVSPTGYDRGGVAHFSQGFLIDGARQLKTEGALPTLSDGRKICPAEYSKEKYGNVLGKLPSCH